MKIAVLFDGAGLARLGLEKAGHQCTGFELDPAKHYLSQFVGSGRCILADATEIDLRLYDAVWASPPCQWRSSARTQGNPVSQYAKDYLQWCLDLVRRYPHFKAVWIENVVSMVESENTWGIKYNAAQFLEEPIQNRNRIIGGKYRNPDVFRAYIKTYRGICPAITATEWKVGKHNTTDTRRAGRYYGRRLTLEECAYHQGFIIPEQWKQTPEGYTKTQWEINQYEAIGNGVPVYMAYLFGITKEI